MGTGIKHLPLSDKEKLQIDLLGAHSEAVKEDEISRRETKIKLIISERSGWWESWKKLCEDFRNKEYTEAKRLLL